MINLRFLEIASKTAKAVKDIVGKENFTELLAINGLPAVPNIGKEVSKRLETVIASAQTSIERKIGYMTDLQENRDSFYFAANMSSKEWNYFDKYNSFPGMVKIPDNVPSFHTSTPGELLGVGERVTADEFKTTIECIKYGKTMIFDAEQQKTAVALPYKVTERESMWPFEIPENVIISVSTAEKAYLNFPCWPEQIPDTMGANYVTMNDTLYQYEPWQIYNTSGPREISFTFRMHRDMWSGDHRDRKFEELALYCQSAVYVNYQGAVIDPPITTITVGNNTRIRGVCTKVDIVGSGPISTFDEKYLMQDLTITIVEVSDSVLTTKSVGGGLGSFR